MSLSYGVNIALCIVLQIMNSGDFYQNSLQIYLTVDIDLDSRLFVDDKTMA